jgi:hypothetical protein
MRPPLLMLLVANVAVAAGAEVTSADLVGKWVGNAPAGFHIVLRADHSFDYIGGDAHGAGKWKLHDGKKLELIYHYDYDPKPISSSSKRSWLIIDSISKDRVRLTWYDKDLSPGFQYSSPEIWTKRR